MSAMEEYATYVWTDPGQFGAWLTSEEQCALLDIFCFYPDGVAETLLKYWVPGRISVSSDHDYYPSWK